jgi:4-carboxymuconolactone decarboxylase
LARLLPGDLDSEQLTVREAIVGGPRAGGPQLFRLVDEDGALEGPFNAFLLSPAVGDALQALGAAVRYRTALTDRAREIAILVVAAHTGAAFEWHAHQAIGRQAGLTDHDLEAIRGGRVKQLAHESERLVALTAQRLVREADLDDDAYADAVAGLGEAGLFELLTLIGYYAALALQLRVFRVGVPDEAGTGDPSDPSDRSDQLG